MAVPSLKLTRFCSDVQHANLATSVVGTVTTEAAVPSRRMSRPEGFVQ